ncbi:phosphate signaling complex protein PhoU [Coralloluteibacterium stylophorae]|uniref:Phosphate-specific transport system accessory protein PhoU n=1 Tax=Coralloluteibacterium stylophorae TaxID=1776034 RepID=A0AAP2CDR0_9GAMM|nr:phosphate signaling complex protein PhoU [Coralloluteibacterium stylophorae]MBS7458938.1 phosphate signaling complex protein PhoU [Coralloluteibacterium stylophorae]
MPGTHILSSHDAELARLTAEIVRMGDIAVDQLREAMVALTSRNTATADEVISRDVEIDALEQQVSEEVVQLALHGPMARDLREILAALRIASDIERVGDYAANLAKRALALGFTAPPTPARGLGALADIAIEMLEAVLEAYRNRDAEAAAAVRARDAELDALYTALFRELLTYMAEDPRTISSAIHLLFVAKNIERIGDHATNIAENIWYVVHGETPQKERDKRDATSTTLAGPGDGESG